MKRPAIIENKPCVYMIKNTVNGKVYIGSSVRPYNRFYRHADLLKRGVHHAIRLQNSFNKYGAEAFQFSILKYTKRENVRKEEARILKMFDATNREKGYNNSDLTDYGVMKHTETTIEKMRKSQQARAANMTDEERARRSEVCKKSIRPVLCSNGMRFDSIADASRYFDVTYSSICRLIQKQRPAGISRCGRYSKLNGLSFNYAEETENVG